MGASVSYMRDELFGVVKEETPQFDLVETTPHFDVRRYGPSIVAEIVYAGKLGQTKETSNAFWVLASYIGAVSAPKNVRPTKEGSEAAEAIAMTAPVITRESAGAGGGEAIAMTAPVVMQEVGEKEAMTAPASMQSAADTTPAMAPPASNGVQKDPAVPPQTPTDPDTSEADLMTRTMKAYLDFTGGSVKSEDRSQLSMQFVLPSKYTMETVPKPLDPRVVVKEAPGRMVGAVAFSGAWNPTEFKEKAVKLREALEAAGHKPRGEYMSCTYNSPLTLPAYRRNEIWYELDPFDAQ